MREGGLECPFCVPWPETVTRQKRSPKRPGTSESTEVGFGEGRVSPGKRIQGQNQTERKELWLRIKLEELAHLKLN